MMVTMAALILLPQALPSDPSAPNYIPTYLHTYIHTYTTYAAVGVDVGMLLGSGVVLLAGLVGDGDG